MQQIVVKGLPIEVRRSTRRKTIDLFIERDGRIAILAPEATSEDCLQHLVSEKLTLIYQKLGRRDEELQRLPPKEFVSGEGFYYLGRKFRLKVLADEDRNVSSDTLRLKNGWFVMPANLVSKGKETFVEWYTKHAKDWITRRIEKLRARVGVESPPLQIQGLGFRWGSCTRKGRMYFHWRIILLPPDRIEYLIVHELVHLHEHNHSPAFYERLRRAAPEYETHEEWLRRNGDQFNL
jgi:predicted metal-dependent hydrolase